MATRRSKALQLLVYMSRTKARGTSALLQVVSAWFGLRKHLHTPARKHHNVTPLLTCILSRVREEAVKAGREEVGSRRHNDVHGTE